MVYKIFIRLKIFSFVNKIYLFSIKNLHWIKFFSGPFTRNPERQLPNKRKRYSSKFLYFRRQVALTQFFPNWKTTKSKRKLAEKYNTWFSFSSISFDESTALHVMYRGLFVAREQKRKNWNVIHRTFPFLQRQLQLEQSICMFILRLNVDGQLVNSRSVSQFSTTVPLQQKVRH